MDNIIDRQTSQDDLKGIAVIGMAGRFPQVLPC